jgi:hypothetical protein
MRCDTTDPVKLFLKGTTYMKKIISILLAAILVLPTTISAYAVEKSAGLTEDKIINIVAALEIMQGDENGKLNLENNVTRAEFAKIMASYGIR